MELKSLALKTDLIFVKQDGEILDRGKYLVVRTTSNPNFFWGNLIIFDNAPKTDALGDWVKIFDKELTDSRIYHKTFAWDSEEIGDIKPFEEAGYKFEKSVVLTATKNQIIAPIKQNLHIRIFPIKESGWREVISIQSEINPQYASFYAKQALTYQKMVKDGLGEWFGAYLGDVLVGSLGIFKENKIGRYQIVSTHPNYQRQGICGTLVYKTAQHAFSHMGIEKLVMVADENYHAARIYESVGFRPTEKMYGVCWSDKSVTEAIKI